MSNFPDSELIINKDGSIYHLNLKPEHLSDYIICVGDPGRVYKVSQHFDDVEFEMNKREFITHIGKYKGHQITVISTGMGTDNIEILMNELDMLASIDLKKREEKSADKKRKLNIIRIGTSGSLQQDIPLGTHLVSDYGIGFDTLMHFYDHQPSKYEEMIALEIQNEIKLPFTPYISQCSVALKNKIAFDMVSGNTVTCPGFYAPQGRKLRLNIKYPHLINALNYFHRDDFWITNMEMETAAYYALSQMMGHETLSVNAIIANRITNQFSKDYERVVDDLIKKVLDRIATGD